VIRNLQVRRIRGQIIFSKEDMIEDYLLNIYKKNLRKNNCNSKDLCQSRRSKTCLLEAYNVPKKRKLKEHEDHEHIWKIIFRKINLCFYVFGL